MDNGLSTIHALPAPLTGSRQGTEHRPTLIGLAAGPALAVLLIGFVVPITILLWRSFSEPTVGFGNYLDALQDPVNIRILVRTFRVAIIVTVVALLFGYPYAYTMTRVSASWRKMMLLLLLVPFWTSVMARSFAWIVILQENGLANSALDWLGLPRLHLLGTEAGVIIGMAQVLLPFTVLPLYATLSTIDQRLISAAQGMGARRSTAFRIVFLPLSVPGILAAGLLTFVLSLGFYVTPDLLGSPRDNLLSQLIATKTSTLLDFATAGALALILLASTLVILAVAGRLTRRLVTKTDEE